MVLWCIDDIRSYVSLRIVLATLLLMLISTVGCRTQQPAETDLAQLTAVITPSMTPIQLKDLAFATLAPPTIEVIQLTPTPLPTSTATPTATPIVYAIQEGDTLLAIAIDNRTTVEEIQQLNPNVRPELLSIGQEITLPAPATPVFSSEQPTAIPIQAEIRSTSLFPDGAGGLWVLGELVNSSTNFVENIQLEIALYGEGGLLVGQATTWAAASLIGPNETSPFAVLLPQKPDGNVQAEVTVINGFAAANLSDDSLYYFGVTADEPQFESDGNAVIATGSITNSGDQPAAEIVGLLTAYDNIGRLIGFTQIAPILPLNPGEAESYSQTLVPLGGEIDSVQIRLFAKK